MIYTYKVLLFDTNNDVYATLTIESHHEPENLHSILDDAIQSGEFGAYPHRCSVTRISAYQVARNIPKFLQLQAS